MAALVILLIVLAFVAFDVLALRFGTDSRDLIGDDWARSVRP